MKTHTIHDTCTSQFNFRLIFLSIRKERMAKITRGESNILFLPLVILGILSFPYVLIVSCFPDGICRRASQHLMPAQADEILARIASWNKSQE